MVNSVSGLNNEFIFPSTAQADLWLFSHGSDQNKLHPFCCFKFLIAFCKIKVCYSFVDINLMHNSVHMMVRNLQLIMLRYSLLSSTVAQLKWVVLFRVWSVVGFRQCICTQVLELIFFWGIHLGWTNSLMKLYQHGSLFFSTTNTRYNVHVAFC